MTLSEALFARLTGESTIAGLVGTRVFPQLAEDPQYPFLTYELTDYDPVRSLTGGSGLASRAIRIACVASTYSQMTVLAEAVTNLLDDDEGEWGDGSESITVQGCFVEPSDNEEIDPAEGMNQDGLEFVRELEFTVWYET